MARKLLCMVIGATRANRDTHGNAQIKRSSGALSCYFSPSALSASCTRGRACIRAIKAVTFGQGVRSIFRIRVPFDTVTA
jgi:hypothetical protein